MKRQSHIIYVLAGTLTFVSALYVGCSGRPVNQQVTDLQAQDHTDVALNPDEKLPDWIDFHGYKDGKLVAVGVAEGSTDTSPVYLQKAAALDAESQLFAKAPHDYRELVQHAVDGSKVEGAVSRVIQTKLTNLKGAVGVETPRSKSYCHKMVRDNVGDVKVTRVCYQQATIPVEDMNKTVERTLREVYGEGKSNEFKNLVDKELEKIGTQPVGKNEPVVSSQKM